MRNYILSIAITVFTLLFIQSGFAQSTIRGTVKFSADNSPLPGATILAKHSGTLSSALDDGSFSLSISVLPDTLIIRYTGMATQIRVISKTNLANLLIVTMETAANLLEEVKISNGYQLIPKERSTGSFALIGNKALNEQVTTNIMDRLEATASGVMIDRGTSAIPKIQIRGISTLGGPRDPLIILNNFPYEGNIANINPNDVESITILKDAAASSIWGARAGNGVIVITTRANNKGQPLSVNFNSNLTVGLRPDLGYIKQMSSNDFINVEEHLFNNGYYTSQISSTARPLLSPVVELFIKRQTANDTEKQRINAQIDVLRTQDVRDDMRKYMYSNSYAQQYNLNMRGSSAFHSWLASAGFDKNKSTLDAGFDRKSLRLENNFYFTEKLNISANLSYTQSGSLSGKPGYGTLALKGSGIYPYAKFADQQGQPLALGKEYRESYVQGLTDRGLLDWKYYPLEDYKQDYADQNLTDLLLNAAIKYKFFNWLSTAVQYQRETQNINTETWHNEQSYYTRSMINQFTVVNTDGSLTRNVPVGDILDLSRTQATSNQIRGQVSIDKYWEHHNLTAIMGAELRETVNRSDTYRTYGYNRETLAFGSVDMTKQYPRLPSSGAVFIPDTRYFALTNVRNLSYYSNLAYTYQNRYTLSASARRDASNLYGLTTNDKWNPLWSAGLAWSVAKEPFFKIPIINELKLRLTYGFSGNTDPARSAVTTLLARPTSPYTLLPYFNVDQVANPSLKWETVRQLNSGIDFAIMNNRISGSLDFYYKKGIDLYGSMPVDYTTGIGFDITRNAASIKGKGWDLVINSLNTTGAIKWSSNINFSHHNDKIDTYYLKTLQATNFVSQTNGRISGLPGNAIYAVYAYKWAGLDPKDGQPQGYVNGAISRNYNVLAGPTILVNDLIYYGSAVPTWYGSMGNTISYKGFDLTVRMLFKFGYFLRRTTNDYSTLYTSWRGHSDYSKRWQNPGDEKHTDIAAELYPQPANLSTFYLNAEPFVIKADHIRLQYLSLNYTIGKERIRKLPFRSIVIYASANNLGILWKANKEGLDPDYMQSNDIPPARAYTAGFRLTY